MHRRLRQGKQTMRLRRKGMKEKMKERRRQNRKGECKEITRQEKKEPRRGEVQ